jgi:RNA polymerase sigma-70 factor (ECF subfamily)
MQPETERGEERSDDLVAAALAGDADAIARLFRREHAPVWRLCMGLLADRDDADDAAQDAMLKLLDQLPRFDPGRAWATWRNTVVLNHCRDRLRRDAARARAEASAVELSLPALLPSPSPGPLDAAARGEVAELVTRSLRHLSPREREAFVLHDLEGGSTDEVAAALSIAESTVRVLLATARRRLRELLAPRLTGLSP